MQSRSSPTSASQTEFILSKSIKRNRPSEGCSAGKLFYDQRETEEVKLTADDGGVFIPAFDVDDRILPYEEMRRDVVRESATADREYRSSL
jgi:hypothetical protein